MLTKELFLGTTIFLVVFTPLVFSNDAYSIKRETVDMQEHAKSLEKENASLNEKFMKLKKDCGNSIKEITDKYSQTDGYREVMRQDLETLIYEHSEVKVEERFSMEALNTAHTMRNKYALKVELYSQELEQLQNRKTTGLSERCHLMKPLFHKYESKSLSTRSLPSRRQKFSEKAEVIVLQNNLNKYKVIVTELIVKNGKLKKQIAMIAKQCDAEIKSIQEKFVKNAQDLSSLTQNVDLMKIEVKELRESSLHLQTKLKNISEEGDQLKARALALKNQIETFYEDKQCYKSIAGLNIRSE